MSKIHTVSLRIVSLSLILSIVIFSSSVWAEKLQKPKVFKGDEDITGWVMSEKLDGIRGYWDGQQLRTRKGKVIHPPKWFVKNFPNFKLDGELWSKRSKFEFIQSVVMDSKPGDEWNQITYNIFEVPDTEGDFLTRLKKAEDWFAANPNKYVRIIPQIKCEGKAHLESFVQEIKSKKGEGVIIKDPKQPYHAGRSPYVLKVKNHDDMEGKVIAVNPGKGRFKGMMGSLTLELENGLTFKIGTGFKKKDRINPPKIGSIVTFKHFGFTKKGKPKFASFMRVRED